jgi:hypothetical protein
MNKSKKVIKIEMEWNFQLQYETLLYPVTTATPKTISLCPSFVLVFSPLGGSICKNIPAWQLQPRV